MRERDEVVGEHQALTLMPNDATLCTHSLTTGRAFHLGHLIIPWCFYHCETFPVWAPYPSNGIEAPLLELQI
jgi:hypothetical protein